MGHSMTQSLISGHPPLIVFTICLTAFGCTMLVLAHVIGEQEVPNPDVQMDWNKFFQKIASFNLCPIQNFTKHTREENLIASDLSSALNSSAPHVVDESKSMSAVLSNVVDPVTADPWTDSAFVVISVKVQFKVTGRKPLDATFMLKGRLKGYLLGLTGKFSQVLFNVSMHFNSMKNESCHDDICSSMYSVCISMNFPMNLLPKSKAPDGCKYSEFLSQEYQPVVFSEISIPTDKTSILSCFSLSYTPDIKLTEMLSPHDRSVVNLHLMHTSYFVFVMVMTLVCYSMIRGRFRQPMNYVSLPKVPSDA